MPAKGLRCLIVSKKMSAFEQVCQKLKGLERVVCYEAEAAKALLSCSSFDYLISYQQISELNGYDGIGLLSHACNHYPKMALLAISENSSSCKLEACDLGKKVVALRESALLDDIANYFGPQKDVFKARVNFSSLTRVEKLDKFLAEQKVHSHLQPILGIQEESGRHRLLGYECLARPFGKYTKWSPDFLFTYASKKEKLYQIDMLCIKAALAEAQKCGLQTNYFINVRPRSLTNPDFVPQFLELAKKFKILPDQIVVELTEQQKINNVEAFTSAISELKKARIKIALDDYGVGFANLNIVHKLEPDFVKLSGIFSECLDKSLENQAIVKSTVDMCRRLKVPMIIENIETKAELTMASQLGADFAQGYYFGRPMPAKSIVRQDCLTS